MSISKSCQKWHWYLFHHYQSHLRNHDQHLPHAPTHMPLHSHHFPHQQQHLMADKFIKFGQGSVDFDVFEYFYFTKYTHTKSKKLQGNIHMFSWTSGLQNPLVQNDFNIFLDEWTSVKV